MSLLFEISPPQLTVFLRSMQLVAKPQQFDVMVSASSRSLMMNMTKNIAER